MDRARSAKYNETNDSAVLPSEPGKGGGMSTLNNLVAIADIQKRCIELAENTSKRHSAEIIQLPLWPLEKRGTPNSFLRSALFAAIQGKDRVYLEEAVLASQKNISVKFTGKQLNQEDLTVWETLVHLARSHPLGNECSFSAHGILKAMELPKGGEQHKQLHSSIIRLTACAVQIKHEGRSYFGSLIEGGVKDEVSSHYHVRLNRDLLWLFDDDKWTLEAAAQAAGAGAACLLQQSPQPAPGEALDPAGAERQPQPATRRLQAQVRSSARFPDGDRLLAGL
jgi:hypothetical protein